MERITESPIHTQIMLANAAPADELPEIALLRRFGEYARQLPLDMEQLPEFVNMLENLTDILEDRLDTLENRAAEIVLEQTMGLRKETQ